MISKFVIPALLFLALPACGKTIADPRFEMPAPPTHGFDPIPELVQIP